MNVIAAPIVDRGVNMPGFTVAVERAFLDKAASGKVIVGVRPEDLTLSTEGADMTVTLVEELGADTYVYGTYKAEDGTNVDLVARGQGMHAPKIGAVVKVNPQRTYIFDTEGDQLRLS
jgi:multiple sugar transport system ATP-binding protein